MVKHIVFWRLKDSAHGNDRATNARLIKHRLEGLRGRVPGLLSIEVGVDFVAAEASSHLALYCEFVDKDALAAYRAELTGAGFKFVGEQRGESSEGRTRSRMHQGLD